MPSGKSWVEVSEYALTSNLAALRTAICLPEATEQPALLAVIKANAYGHGASLCGPILARAGAEWLGVTDAQEGAAVRQALTLAGIAEQPRILLMCGLEAADAALIVQHRLTPVVWFPEQLSWLAAASDAGNPIPIHVEVDTGMARQGVLPGPDLSMLLAKLRTYPQLRLDGVMTHFASAEIANSQLTAAQQHRFEQGIAQVKAADHRPAWLHAGNTSTLDEGRLLAWMAAQAEALRARLLVRSGLALYGYALPLEGAAPQLAPSLMPVGSWRSHIIGLRDLAVGETVGYNATFTATMPMRVALLPVGYADGLRRELSSSDEAAGGWVMIRSQRARILGRISMNLSSVDVTHIPDAALGDAVTLLGHGMTADDHARLAHTIPYEILCGMRGEPMRIA